MYNTPTFNEFAGEGWVVICSLLRFVAQPPIRRCAAVECKLNCPIESTAGYFDKNVNTAAAIVTNEYANVMLSLNCTSGKWNCFETNRFIWTRLVPRFNRFFRCCHRSPSAEHYAADFYNVSPKRMWTAIAEIAGKAGCGRYGHVSRYFVCRDSDFNGYNVFKWFLNQQLSALAVRIKAVYRQLSNYSPAAPICRKWDFISLLFFLITRLTISSTFLCWRQSSCWSCEFKEM